MKTTLPLSAFPGANPLVRDYASDFDRVRPWFHYDPHAADALESRLAEIDSRQREDRTAAAKAVTGQLQRWGAGAVALEAAGWLGQPETVTVVTGQQAGLLGGPLYAVLKAVSAVKLARQLGVKQPDRRFVPTFWISSGDSDFDEVRTTSIIGQDGSLADLALDAGPAEEESLIVAARDTANQMQALLAALNEVLPGGQFREEVQQAVSNAYSTGNLVDGFARWMLRLFADTELVVIDPQLPELMACATPLLERELSGPEEGEERLAARNSAISGAGYQPQVEQLPGDTNLFLLDGSGHREKIGRTGAGFMLRPSGRELTADELLKEARSNPASFVCGVMLRPVYQNVLFPPAAFVGGAAELAYRAQATTIFDHHGEKMAPAFLRASATLLSGRQAGLLDELGWELSECYTVPQDLAASAVATLRPGELDKSMERYREQLAAADRELQAYAETLDPGLGKSFETLRDNLMRHADKLEKKISGSLKQKHSALVGQVGRLHTAVYPGLEVQERRLGILGFLPRHGFGLVQRLIDTLTFPAWDHQVVVLD